MATTQGATPAATTFSTFGHPLVGTRKWTNYPDSFRVDFSYATFAEDGRYVDFSDIFLAIGTWRATGERTAELVLMLGVSISLDAAFEPGYVITEDCLVTRDTSLVRVTIEVDETGNRMSGTGSVELPAANNRIDEGYPFEGRGDRMTIAAEMPAPPAPC